MKFPIRFYCALGVSAAFRVILTNISKRSSETLSSVMGFLKIFLGMSVSSFITKPDLCIVNNADPLRYCTC